MRERDVFGPRLARLRRQRGISLDSIAAATKISPELLEGLEQNDFSRWPTGIYARAYVRAYAAEVGADPEAIVDDFCRWFPQGDRRAERIVRGSAALVGHQLDWRDDLVGVAFERDRRARAQVPAIPGLAVPHRGRLVAALADLAVAIVLGFGAAALLRFDRASAVATVALLYHAASLATLGCTPAVWVIDTYLANRHPAVGRVFGSAALRLFRGTERVKV
jgi:transcriptional regulator with XRE-family HTH domain